MMVFKRRKPDGLPVSETDLAATEGEIAAESFLVNTAPAPRGADTGLGVPPFRPAPTTPKEAPAMSRPPFPQTPSAAPGTPLGAPHGVGQTGIPAAPARPVGGPVVAPSAPVAARPARDPEERRTLVVGRGISVQGTVQDAERLVVEGTVEATMIHARELAIAPGGVFKGEVEVEEAEIAGTIDGTLTARASLIVRSTGRVLGKARCRRLQVEDGGQITGQIEMLTEPASSRAEAPRVTAESAA